MSNTTTNSFPSVFNGFGRWMLPSRFAVWFPAKSDYQIYTVDRDDWPVIRLTPTMTDRTNPFHFACERADDRSRTFTLYRPRARIHSHIDLAVWHTGGWLCRKQGHSQIPVVPILGVSDTSKMVFDKNVGIVVNPEFEEWKEFQSLFFTRPIIHNRIVAIPQKPKEIPAEIPAFVAEALLEKAMASDQICAISMEAFEKEKCAATSCYHLFRRDALQEWRKTHTDCPVCKQECSLTYC